MKKYYVTLETTASMSVVVEADNEEEAIDKAMEEHLPITPCHMEPFSLGDWDVPNTKWAVEEVTE